ncbi:MAG: adenylyl-sulfate kinase [Prosthecobacter sp.]
MPTVPDRGGSLPTDGGNITWSHSDVSREDRWRLLGQRGGLVWFTGLSGSGKSTLAAGLDVYLHRLRRASFVLDGDNLRHGLCRDLGFSAADRAENIRRAGEVACLMAEAGLIVICALISPLLPTDSSRVNVFDGKLNNKCNINT